MTKLVKKSLIAVMSVIFALCAFATLGASTVKADSTVITSVGASIRFDEPTGIKFGAEISAVNENATYGFAIVPDYYLTKKNITENYIPALIDAYTEDGIILLASIPVEGAIYGSVGNIREENFDLTFAGIPYEKIGDAYTYGDVIYASVLDVSTKLLNKYHYEQYPFDTEELAIIDGFMAKALESEGKQLAISIDSEKTLGFNETVTLEATTDLDKEFIVWESDNPAVATVENGVVTAKWEGVANVTASIAGVSSTCVISVEVPDVYNISLDNAYVNPGEDYTLNLNSDNAYFYGKSGVQFVGSGSGTNSWRDNLFIDVEDYVGYDWLLVDMLIDTANAAFFVKANTDNYVWATAGETCTNGSFYSVIESDGVYYSVPFVYGQWITVAFKIADFNGKIDAIVSNSGTYISSIKAVKSSVVGEIQTTLPDTLEVSNYTLGVYPGADWTLSSSYELENYEGKQAVKLVSGSQQDYKNRAIIFTRQFVGYKWMLIDFYFNTGYVHFSDNTGNYQALSATLASTNGHFYAVSENEGEYVNVPGTRGQWITVAFRISSYANFVDFIVGSNSQNYFANIRLVKSTVFDEPVEDESGDDSTLALSIGSLIAEGITLSTVNGIGGRDGVIQSSVNSGVLWHSSYATLIVTDYVALGYDTFYVDVYSSAALRIFFANGGLASIANGEAEATGAGVVNGGISILDADGNPTTYATNTWTTLKFDLTKIGTSTVVRLFRENTSVMYFSNLYLEKSNA